MFSGAAHAESAPLSPSVIADAAESAGLPCVPAVAVAEAESDGVPDAVGPMGELGAWQVYPAAWPGLAEPARGSVTEQAQAAATVYHAQGWAAWTTYGQPRYEAALPTARAACGRHAAETMAAQTGPGRHAAQTVTVSEGQTLGDIGWAHGTTAAALFDANRDVLDNPDLIHVGDVLTIPRS
jgi:nucleoid-associated protein YgaU